MGLWKRGKQYWFDAVVHGERHREPLGTTDWREAKDLEKKRLAELQKRPPDPTKRAHKFSALSIADAIAVYAGDRRSQVSERTVAWWKENAIPLVAFLGDKPLRKIGASDLTAYQNARIDAGCSPKSVNGELSVLRQLLRHAKLWYRFADDYKPLKNTKPPAGQAITDDEQAHLFAVAKSKPQWMFAYVAATLDFFCGMRACEIKALQWKHISWEQKKLAIRRSKTPAGWRDPSLNETCLDALRELHKRAAALGFAQPEHFLFLWHGRDKKLDPTRPMKGWRSAWRSLRTAAGLDHVRFHDGRHTALTRLAEKGVPDWVIRAQFGHVSTAMMAVYSHVRRKALDEAAKALEPDASPAESPSPEPIDSARPMALDRDDLESRVMSHVTSQPARAGRNVIEFPKKIGSSGWTRTSNPPVNSRMLCH